MWFLLGLLMLFFSSNTKGINSLVFCWNPPAPATADRTRRVLKRVPVNSCKVTHLCNPQTSPWESSKHPWSSLCGASFSNFVTQTILSRDKQEGRGEETRCDSIARGSAFTGTWCYSPATLRATAFSLPTPPPCWNKASAVETERDPEVHTTSATSQNRQRSTWGETDRRMNGQKLRAAAADRHRVTTVTSKWSDTRERGRRAERETCHNKETSPKQRGEDKGIQQNGGLNM